MCPLVSAAPNANVILQTSDRIRNPNEPFSVETSLTEYSRGRVVDQGNLIAFSREIDKTGRYSTLVHIFAPARDKDKRMLKSGNDLWIYDPIGKASVRVSPQQRLVGATANGDVVTVNYAKDYDVSLAAEETISDSERQPRQAYRLALRATAPDVTYHSIDFWVDQQNSRPIKARFYTESGRLLKTAFYRRYEMAMGMQRPTEIVIIDGLDTDSVTVLRLSNYRSVQLPPSWLQRDYLPHFEIR
ncbi:outer membrane lipoprotein-sorting protein [Burkholderia pyrrocinia]|uniref:outer membrane lipoprotein-sorting protein n=1 Tax=Burkholderia pyrrocinia TaxID=60550 RepID=UPI001A9E8BB6|nr:outer membrane lipoprotein-sorting protein [Burkholderia pyrrocinia]